MLLREIGPANNKTRCSGLSKRCLAMHDTRHNQHQLIQSDNPSDKISIKRTQNQWYQ